MINIFDYYEETAHLSHHGIKGQKWGVKNGPPYPIDKNKAAKEKKEKL